MSCSSGPKVVSGNLVFAYDMTNVERSWLGEPTTNLIPSPEKNARFQPGNTWGCYQVNQYNANQFFSIGTIVSVTGNLVETAAPHPLRTYDVVTPQTTGGGVTAGISYFIRKVSSTGFTIHTFNNSSDGSQGYLVPGTAYRKVHESIGLDQRIAVNATDFPVMWKGPPHLNNSGMVKELVDGAGPDKQRVMRLHVFRTDCTPDAFAYGVQPLVTAGDSISLSYWMRTSRPSQTVSLSTYFGAGNATYSSANIPLSSLWERKTHVWTASATSAFIMYWYPSSPVGGAYWIDICDIQAEVNKQSVTTPFTIYPRTTGNCLKDLTDTYSLTATNLDYNLDGTFSLDGTSSYVDFGADKLISPANQGWSAEYWFRSSTPSTLQSFSSADADDFNANWLSVYQGKLAMWNASPGYWRYGSTVLQADVMYQAVFVCDSGGTNMRFYLNGVREGGDHVGNIWNAAYSALKIRYLGVYAYTGVKSRYFNGQIPVVRLYNKALTDEEVLINFTSLGSRCS